MANKEREYTVTVRASCWHIYTVLARSEEAAKDRALTKYELAAEPQQVVWSAEPEVEEISKGQ